MLFQALHLQFGAHIYIFRDQKVLEIKVLGLATFYHILSPVLTKHPLTAWSGSLVWDGGGPRCCLHSPEPCYLRGIFLS